MRAAAAIATRTPVLASPVAALAGVLGVAAALRFSELGARGFWRDEAVTVQLVRKSFGGMLGAIPHSEGTPPLYYVLAWGWTRLFGTSEAGIRSLSALAGTLAVAVVYLIGRELFGRRVALAAALLAAVHPLLVWHAQDARAYSLYVLLGAASLSCFVRALGRPTRGHLAAWAATSALALCTHYFAAFLVVPEAAWLLRAHLRRPTMLAVAAVGFAGVALLPLALEQRSSASVAWIGEIARWRRVRELAEEFLVGPQPPHRDLLAAVVGVCALAALAMLLARGGRRERRGAALLGALAIATVALPLALSLAGLDYFLSRNAIAAWAPLALVVAAGVASRSAGLAGAALLAAICAVSVGVVAASADEPKFGGEDWRGAARALGPATADRAVVLWLGVGEGAFALYRPHAAPLPATGAVVREVDVVAVGPSHDAALLARRDSLFPRPPFRRAGRIEGRFFVVVRFVAPAPRRVRRQSLVSGAPAYSAAVLLDRR
ncbi:MAG TPA: glycosyltransferase family 39 protein [Gaiellaceae bacterium]|nr:glycosyltransferase family 39 protein [Gaiellaceae bacterium]